ATSVGQMTPQTPSSSGISSTNSLSKILKPPGIKKTKMIRKEVLNYREGRRRPPLSRSSFSLGRG
ncbi:hypothetical protein L9F63_020009, partial [Diploptera punctata]